MKLKLKLERPISASATRAKTATALAARYEAYRSPGDRPQQQPVGCTIPMMRKGWKKRSRSNRQRSRICRRDSACTFQRSMPTSTFRPFPKAFSARGIGWRNVWTRGAVSLAHLPKCIKLLTHGKMCILPWVIIMKLMRYINGIQHKWN